MSAITFTKEAFEDALQKQIIRNIKSMQIIDTMFVDQLFDPYKNLFM